MRNRTHIILRLTLAGVTGLVVAAIALSSGVSGGAYYVGMPQYLTGRRMVHIGKAIKLYQQKTKSLPRSLSQLKDLKDAPIYVGDDGTVLDSWGHPFVYSLQGSHYRVLSYGRDGKPGGVGLDYDLTNLDYDRTNGDPKPPAAAPTAQQILSHPKSTGMIFASLFSGVLTFLIMLSAVKPQDLDRRVFAALAIRLFVTFVGAALVGVFITTLHIPSGH